MAKNIQAKLVLGTSKPRKSKKKRSKAGAPMKQKDKEEQAVEEKKSARELAEMNAKKQGASIAEQQRIAGKTKATKPKPKGKPASTGAKIKKGGTTKRSMFGKSTRKKSTKKSSTTTKKVVAKRKPRSYSTNPQAVRSRERRAKQQQEAQVQALIREGMSQRPIKRSRPKRK